MTLKLKRVRRRRRIGGICVRQTARNRHRPQCHRFRFVGSLDRSSALRGRNSVRFSGRIGNRGLRPGRYRVKITAVDAAGNVSAPRRLGVTIVRH